MSKAGAALLVACACLSCVDALSIEVDARRDELSALKGKIRALQADIARSEESKDDAADDLALADQSVFAAQSRLIGIGKERERIEADLAGVLARRTQVEQELFRQRRNLGDVLYRWYLEGGQAGARHLLSGEDPNQLARDAHYLGLIATQRLTVVAATREAGSELHRLGQAVEARRSQLLVLEKGQQAEQTRLIAERARQKDLLIRISSQLRDQQRVMLTLQSNEDRLEKLLRGLERIARENARAAAKRKPVAFVAKPVARPKNDGTSAAPGGEVASGTSHPLPPPQEAGAGSSFASTKGRLHWPVAGELIGRFGGLRSEGGSTWRGLFIKSATGSEVRAVADGTVAFADWLRGFGNLIIVDHGGGYMTVYGNNEAVLKSPGEGVRAGETIAKVGGGEGLNESGLYFEVRFRGQPQDPAKWVGTR